MCELVREQLCCERIQEVTTAQLVWVSRGDVGPVCVHLVRALQLRIFLVDKVSLPQV